MSSTTAAHTSPRSVEWLDRDAEALAPTLSRITDLVIASGEGSRLVDVDGRRWLDLSSGIGVTATGHCHPRVVAAIREQAGALLHTSVVAHHTLSVRLAERLAATAPFLADPQVFFCNTGAEAIDGVIKLARRVTGRPGIVAFRGAFHGRTIGGTSLTTSKAKYRLGYEPLLPSVGIAPYPSVLRHGSEAAATAAALGGLDEMFHAQLPPASIAAVIVEPVLGEGGYVVPPVAWLQGLRDRCDEHGILLVFDEVQSGVGRTGTMWAAEGFGVAPDVLLFAKGIASGLPLGGILAGGNLFARWSPGSHGTTFGGNPVSCAAGLATLDVLADECLVPRAGALGAAARATLSAQLHTVPGVVDVRGRGLMLGVELADGLQAAEAQRRALDDGVVVLTCGPHDEVLRIVPALTITDAELDEGLGAVVAAVRAAAA
jgi:4-aminobutyrate aminotransferase